MKYSKDGVVSFDEKTHSYFNGSKRLTSVTQYIKQFKPVFDSDLIASKYAKKHNLIKEDVLKMWSDKASESCEMGTVVHKIFEDYILNNPVDINNDYVKSKIAIKFIEDYFLSKRLIPVETEYIVYNDHLAGQVDCIAKNNNNEYFIIDWKTNKQINFQNKWQKMLNDYSYLDDCNYNHYSIQLSKYKEMCSEYVIKDCFIVHLKEDDYQIIKA